MNATKAGLPLELVASNPMQIGPEVVPATLAGPPLEQTSPEKPASLQNACKCRHVKNKPVANMRKTDPNESDK